jgi:ADP-ribose pyrophosphatase
MKHHVKVGKFKQVFKGKIFTISQAKAIMPSGKVHIYEMAKRMPVAMVFALDKGKIIITKEYRFNEKRFMWWIPGGFFDEKEKPEDAARRELLEETGYYAKKLKLLAHTKGSTIEDFPYYYFLATDLEKRKKHLDDSEEIRVYHKTLDEIFEMVLKGEFTHERHVFAIMRLYGYLKKK